MAIDGDDDLAEVALADEAVVVAGVVGIDAPVDQRLVADVDGAVGHETRHVDRRAGGQRHGRAGAGALVFEQHQADAAQADVDLGRLTAFMEMAARQVILVADAAGKEAAEAVAEIAGA